MLKLPEPAYSRVCLKYIRNESASLYEEGWITVDLPAYSVEQMLQYALDYAAEPCRQPISREQATAIAREAAVAARDAGGTPAHSYLPMDSGENWHPHEWVVEAIMAAASAEPQPERKPLSRKQKREMWIAATIESCSHENCYLRGIADAERAHGIGDK